MKEKRSKTWDQKVELVRDCYLRCKDYPSFADNFYRNLFFLKPSIETYFQKTDWPHQKKALLFGLEHLMEFLKGDSEHHRSQVMRLAKTHSKGSMNIHPHDYYYWIEALILTLEKLDNDWFDDLRYYCRECLFFPVSFMISLYHKY